MIDKNLQAKAIEEWMKEVKTGKKPKVNLKLNSKTKQLEVVSPDDPPDNLLDKVKNNLTHLRDKVLKQDENYIEFVPEESKRFFADLI